MRTSPSLSSRASGMSPPDSALAPHAGSSQRRARHRRLSSAKASPELQAPSWRRWRLIEAREYEIYCCRRCRDSRYTPLCYCRGAEFRIREVQSSRSVPSRIRGGAVCRVPDPFHPEIQCAEGVNTRTGTERRGGAVRNVQVTRSGAQCSERSVYLASLDCGVRCEEKAECTMQLSTHHPSST